MSYFKLLCAVLPAVPLHCLKEKIFVFVITKYQVSEVVAQFSQIQRKKCNTKKCN